MGKCRNDNAGCSQQRDSQKHPLFEPFSTASLQPLQSELGRPLLPFSTPVGSFHQFIRREDAARIGEGGNHNSQGRLLETNSSLTPLDLYRPSGSWTCQEDGSATTSGITPCSWLSLFSDFKVPSLNNSGKTLKSNSTARNVPRDGSLGSYEDDHSGRLRLGDADGEQMVPVQNVRSGTTGANACNLFQAQSSQFSNSWPVEGKGVGNTLTRGGEGAGFVGSDQGSFTGSRQRPKLTSEQRDEAGASGSSPFSLPSIVYSNNPIYAPRPSYAFPRVAVGLKGKNKVDDTSDMNLEEHGIGGKRFGRSSQGVRGIPVQMGPDVGNPWRGLPNPEGLNNNLRSAVPGDCKDFGAKRCSNWEEDTQPMDTDDQPFCSVEPGDKVGTRQSSEAEEFGHVHKQSRLRSSSDAADEAGPSGFIKRSRQHQIDSSWKVWGDDSEQVPQRDQENGVGTEKAQTCNWLQRWLPPNSSVLMANADGRSKLAFSGLGHVQASKSSTENMREEHGREWNRFQNRLTDFSSKGELFKLSPFSTPSASALAMIGTASRCLGPPLTQHKGSIMMRPSGTKMLKVKHVRFAEPQRSS